MDLFFEYPKKVVFPPLLRGYVSVLGRVYNYICSSSMTFDWCVTLVFTAYRSHPLPLGLPKFHVTKNLMVALLVKFEKKDLLVVVLYWVTKSYCTCWKVLVSDCWCCMPTSIFVLMIEAERSLVFNLLRDLALICSWRKTQHVVLWLEPCMVHRFQVRMRNGTTSLMEVFMEKNSQVDEKRRWGQAAAAFWKGYSSRCPTLWASFWNG